MTTTSLSWWLVALVLGLGWWVARGRVHQARKDGFPPGVVPRREYRSHSSEHFDAACTALKAFAAEYRSTFVHGGCTGGSLRSMTSLRAEALRHMYQLRMRLPNDMDAEGSMTQHIEAVDRVLQEYILDVQTRCGLGSAFPGPIDNAYYRNFYRAHNDVAE